jgi:hypothetical protein
MIALLFRITLKINNITVFLLVNFEAVFNAEFVGTYMTYHHIQPHTKTLRWENWYILKNL